MEQEVTSHSLSRFKNISVNVGDQSAAIALNRPPVNALSTLTYRELGDAFEALAEIEDVRAIIFRSSVESVFSAGADMKEPSRTQADGTQLRHSLARRAFEAILASAQPVVCEVTGPALGAGCVLTSLADIRVAGQGATFGLPEIGLCRLGGARHLMRVLPQGAVRLLYFTGRPITADEAYRLGMVDRLVAGPLESVKDETQGIVDDIIEKSGIALRLSKRALRLVEEDSMSRGYEIEQHFSTLLSKTADAQEASRAFREKRPPSWKNR